MVNDKIICSFGVNVLRDNHYIIQNVHCVYIQSET